MICSHHLFKALFDHSPRLNKTIINRRISSQMAETDILSTITGSYQDEKERLPVLEFAKYGTYTINDVLLIQKENPDIFSVISLFPTEPPAVQIEVIGSEDSRAVGEWMTGVLSRLMPADKLQPLLELYTTLQRIGVDKNYPELLLKSQAVLAQVGFALKLYGIVRFLVGAYGDYLRTYGSKHDKKTHDERTNKLKTAQKLIKYLGQMQLLSMASLDVLFKLPQAGLEMQDLVHRLKELSLADFQAMAMNAQMLVPLTKILGLLQSASAP